MAETVTNHEIEMQNIVYLWVFNVDQREYNLMEVVLWEIKSLKPEYIFF